MVIFLLSSMTLKCVGCIFLEDRKTNELDQTNGNAQTNQSSKRRWKKPISCMTVRNFPGCKQS